MAPLKRGKTRVGNFRNLLRNRLLCQRLTFLPDPTRPDFTRLYSTRPGFRVRSGRKMQPLPDYPIGSGRVQNLYPMLISVLFVCKPTNGLRQLPEKQRKRRIQVGKSNVVGRKKTHFYRGTERRIQG